MTDVRLGSMVAERHGAGPAVVMVHGLGGSSGSFETLMPALGGYCVLRPDLPGAGRSALRPGRPGLAGLGAALRECLRALGVSRAHLVGHSMGALVCQQVAAAAPELVASLTLYGALLEPAPAARAALAERAREARTAGMSAIADAVAAGSLGPGTAGGAAAAFVRESVLRQSPAGFAAHCVALAAARAPDHGAIRCPCLLVHGRGGPGGSAGASEAPSRPDCRCTPRDPSRHRTLAHGGRSAAGGGAAPRPPCGRLRPGAAVSPPAPRDGAARNRFRTRAAPCIGGPAPRR